MFDFKNTFRALRSRNFRLFFIGQGVSLIGTWMQRVAMSWLVYRLTDSAYLLGIVGFASHIPIFILAPFAGVLIDRYDRKKILMITQTVQMLQAFLLAYLSLTGQIQVWQLISLSFVLGVASAFDIPSRQSFYVQMVRSKDDVSNAIALNSTSFHIARFAGPSLAGLAIAFLGEGICFLLNGFSYVVVIAALQAMKIKALNLEDRTRKIYDEFKEGVQYVVESAAIKKILLLVASMSLFGSGYMILLPIFAKDILGGGPLTLGLLTSFTSVGALVSSFYIASWKKIDGAENSAIFFGLLFGAAIILFAFSNLLAVSVFLIAFAGAGMMGHNASINSLIQNLTTEEKRGRVMSLYTFSHQGIMPFGELLLGLLAGLWGGGNAIFLSGIFSMFSILIFGPALVSALKTRKAGILKEA
ncbi:MFS transporter [Candidatus Giovannonibacteria bacterium]|nr:MFS transporter [Candidatus Giovannonibacteria bacterium]